MLRVSHRTLKFRRRSKKRVIPRYSYGKFGDPKEGSGHRVSRLSAMSEKEREKFGSPASPSSFHFPFFVALQGAGRRGHAPRGCNEDRRIRNVGRAQAHRQQRERLHKREMVESSCGHADRQRACVARCE
jgi:hypothetical protein